MRYEVTAIFGQAVRLARKFDAADTNLPIHYGRWIGLQLRTFAGAACANTGLRVELRLMPPARKDEGAGA